MIQTEKKKRIIISFIIFKEIADRLVGFYDISTFVGYLTPNPQFSLA